MSRYQKASDELREYMEYGREIFVFNTKKPVNTYPYENRSGCVVLSPNGIKLEGMPIGGETNLKEGIAKFKKAFDAYAKECLYEPPYSTEKIYWVRFPEIEKHEGRYYITARFGLGKVQGGYRHGT